MKKIFLLILSLLIITAYSACNQNSSDDTETGYVDPYFDTVKTQAIKSYSVAGYACASNKACGAVLYSGKLNKVGHVGFAAGKDSINANFSLKIYWYASSIPSSLDTTSYSVSITDGNYTYTTTSDNLNITITSGTDTNSVTVYTINIAEDITVSDGNGHSLTINSGDNIVAYKYPE